MSLRIARETRQLTLNRCAKRAGIDPAALSRYETGRADLRNCSLERALRLARVLNLTPYELLRLAGPRRSRRRPRRPLVELK